MAELTIANTYASALFQVAKEMDKVEFIREELEAVQSIIDSEPDFLMFLNTPCISAAEKNKVMKAVFKGKICDELLNFISIIIDKGRTRHFPKMLSIYKELLNREEGFAYGTIYSAVPLPEDKLSRFEEEASKLIRENVRLENEIDKTLIGGVKILIEGKIIDASVKARVSAIAETIR